MPSVEEPFALAQELDHRFGAQCARLGCEAPWFGRVVLAGAGGPCEYFVGRRRNVDERIVDWQHPMAAAYYEHRPGDEFELEAPGYALVGGKIASRAQIEAAHRRIRKIELTTLDGPRVLVAGDDGFTRPEEARRAREERAGLPDITALLTPEQYLLITASRSRPVIVQGRAGSGKTSVALYRVAWLTWAAPEATAPPVDPARVLIVMFNRALSTFVRGLLAPLGLEGVQLNTFHAWALDTVQRAYGGELAPNTDELPGKATAIALKKQLGILRATEAFVQRQAEALDGWLERWLATYDREGHWIARFRQATGPMARRVVALRSAALAARDAATTSRDQQRLHEIYRVFRQAAVRSTLYKEDLLRLLTHRELLAAHLPDARAEELADLARYQAALQSIGGDARRPGPSVAFEDLAILLRLILLKHGGYPNSASEDEVTLFDHLVLDEAQDFGAVELQVLLASVRSRTGVTIVGDSNQRIVPDARFIGWDALAAELGVEGATVARLDVAHRSTAAILAVADALIGAPPSGGRPGQLPSMTVVPTRAALVSTIAELAARALAESPSAHVCVVARHAGAVRSLATELGAVLGNDTVRVGHNREFTFAPGVTVTNLLQVKGLEFDVVILVDPTDASYPDTDEGRRHLYTMVTRARDALHLVSTEPPGRHVRAAIDAGRIELEDRAAVPKAEFGPEDDEPF
ncbi:MAG: ATP-binding domain-containing protein [Polyangiaceae bacterium]|nr:ATP-binding domain-containing protein [Polyangiaceae bacterium]